MGSALESARGSGTVSATVLALALAWASERQGPQVETTGTTLPRGEALRRIARDHDLLLRELERRPAAAWRDEYRVRGGPLGDFCESLHDLLGHVLMWDEIGLAVLTEHGRRRRHWSLAARWETAEAGRQLNLAGVTAARQVSGDLLAGRFAAVRDALTDEIGRYDDESWHAAAPGEDGADAGAGAEAGATGVGALAQYAMTVPEHDAYWHAAIHLGLSTREL